MKRADITRPEPAPVTRPGAPSLHDVAAALHADRRDHGRDKYGSLLQTFNQRNARIDRVQESLDHLVYEIQDLIEGEAERQVMAAWLVDAEHNASHGGSGREVLDMFEEMCNPAAVALRADAIAAELIGDGRG